MRVIIEFPEEIRERIEKICSDISKRDNSFKYKINKKLLVETENEKRAWAIGFWFKQKGLYSEDDRKNNYYRRKIRFRVVKMPM